MSSPLPLDIYELIIRELHDDQQSLNSCARVCCSWVSPARRGIFHTISLSEETPFAQLSKLFQSAPDIAKYVRYLVIENAAPKPRIGAFDPADGVLEQPSSWFEDYLPLLSMMNQVDTLKLSTCNWARLSVEARKAIMSSLLSIKRLLVVYGKFQTFEMFQELLTSFPQLIYVDFDSVKCGETLIESETGGRGYYLSANNQVKF